MRESRFAAYVDAARNGKNALWRIVLAVAVIAGVWLATSVVLAAAGLVAISIRDGNWPLSSDEIAEAADLKVLVADPIGTGILLLSVASLWLGTWLALKVVHKRSIRDLLGTERRLHWPDFARATVVTLILATLSAPVVLLIDPTLIRGNLSLFSWLAVAPLLLVAVFLQSSAEEIVFRGYFHQVLAARFAAPLIWLAVPTALFTLLHWQSEASPAMNLAGLFVILALSLSMSRFLVATGNLGASMGVHFGNNISAIMLFSSSPDYGAAALLKGRSILDPGWTTSQAIMLGLYGVLVVGGTQALLLHRASPVRLRSLSERAEL